MRGRVGVGSTGLAFLGGSQSMAATSYLARDFVVRSWIIRVDVRVGSALGPDISQ